MNPQNPKKTRPFLISTYNLPVNPQLEPVLTPLPDSDSQRLQQLLGRKPSRIEQALALALWNEHCSYKSSKRHLKKFRFPTRKAISALDEQAGIIDLGQGEKVTFKMESHNHPSFIVPYHGAATGAGGILRDIFAMGARPLALADYLCFGQSSAPGNARRVDEVIRGIGDYGNCIGVPTITGQTEFSASYNKNILVNALALGYFKPGDEPLSAKAENPGHYVVYAGSATGRDGIMGASMASASFSKEGGGKEPTVQVGDPFFGKQLMESALRAMRENLISACQDMGAAGLTCAGFEMSEKGGRGLRLNLDKVPLRDKSLGPEEILLSESQERLLFTCPASQWPRLKALFEERGLEICILGEVLQQKEMELFWQGRLILKTDPAFWTSQAPKENRPFVKPEAAPRALPRHFSPVERKIKPLLLKILSGPEGQSRRFVYSQYDQRVGTNTLKDASYPIAVIKLPASGRELGLALGCRPCLMACDVEQGAKDAVFYPALQLALRGFEPLALTDCLNFGNPEKANIMGEFVTSVESIAQAAQALDTPVVSGNVSFYNESGAQNITPTPSIGMIGLKEGAKALPSAGFQTPGEKVYLLASQSPFCFQGALKNYLPAKEQSDKVYGALQEPLVRLFIGQIKELSENLSLASARVVGKFGLLYQLARMVLDKGIGVHLRADFPLPLLQERLYEIIVSVKPEDEKPFQEEIQRLALNSFFIGQTRQEGDLIIKKEIISCRQMRSAYFKPWEEGLV